jgi:hypothetical protein
MVESLGEPRTADVSLRFETWRSVLQTEASDQPFWMDSEAATADFLN